MEMSDNSHVKIHSDFSEYFASAEQLFMLKEEMGLKENILAFRKEK